VKLSIVFIHLGSSGSASPRGAPVPLAHRHHQQQHAEHELHHTNPVRWGAVLARVGAAGEKQQNRSDDRESRHPAGKERQAVGPALRRGEHQHHRDDRHRAERDADAEWQHLTDRPASLVVAAGRDRQELRAAAEHRRTRLIEAVHRSRHSTTAGR
jgi:hypothetical protein